MNNIASCQEYGTYRAEDHAVWEFLNQRQKELLSDDIAEEYLEGCLSLGMDSKKIIRIEEVSERLTLLSGWSLVPVDGLIPIKHFFTMLINGEYPITVGVRDLSEVDFTDHPDIFHDACGHLPLLTNEKFGKFLRSFGRIAIKYLNNQQAVELLGRIYWFTCEMGLIRQLGGYKAYGAAIITSSGEISNVRTPGIPKYPFDIDHIFDTSYSYDDLQERYFVIESFDDLFNCLNDLESKLQERLMTAEPDPVLRNYPLNRHIGLNFNNVIGFLNDLQVSCPNAISFVAGQPDEGYFDIDDQVAKYNVFVDAMVRKTGGSRDAAIKKLGQYSRTKGIINDIIADYLKKDENISVGAEDILITAGAQEAFAIIVGTICGRQDDVILVEDPGYIGLSSFAKAFNYPIAGIRTDEEGIDLQELKKTIIGMRQSGKHAKLLYIIPDYQNPSGYCMPIGNRLELLQLAWKYNFLIIEDCVYNTFSYDGPRIPSLKSMDRYHKVIHVGSFSKTLFPGLRIGFVAADQKVENEAGDPVSLLDEMVKIKAQLSNNTSTIGQAIVGGILLNNDNSLAEWNRRKCESYRRKRDKLISSLDKYIKGDAEGWAHGITWNHPQGGFFVRMTLPFDIDAQDVADSAARFGVVFSPMRYFFLHKGGEKEIRLTFSNLSLQDIDTGIQRLAAYLKSRSVSACQLELLVPIEDRNI